MRKITQKIEMIIFTGKDRIKRVLKDNSGQGAIDTAIICEPFCEEWEV